MKTLLYLILFTGVLVNCQPASKNVRLLPIFPKPTNLIKGNGSFIFTNKTIIKTDSLGQQPAELLSKFVFNSTGVNVPISREKGSVIFETKELNLGEEGYKLHIKQNEIVVQSSTQQGMFNAVQTILQLFPVGIFGTMSKDSLVLPQLKIEDNPFFAYRGMHLDVGRHMFPPSAVKKYIDILSMHKINTFHWHLTEDQGWRVEIKKYPKLAEISSQRKETVVGHAGTSKEYDGKPYGGYYTQEEIKNIVAYATARGVVIIPEIEMPGHSVEVLAAYPELGCTKGPYEVRTTFGVSDDIFCAGNEKTFEFLENVLSEVMELFPSQYIHIGGDEAPKKRWENCTADQLRIKQEGLKDEHDLQAYFINRIEKFLNVNGRKLVGWDEITEGDISSTATVMYWRSWNKKSLDDAFRNGNKIILTPSSHYYFDHYQADPAFEPLAIGGYSPLHEIYQFDPLEGIPKDKRKNVLGAQANVWTEYMPNFSQVTYMLVPRITALSEVLWTADSKRDFNDFKRRLKTQFKRFDAMEIKYAKDRPLKKVHQ